MVSLSADVHSYFQKNRGLIRQLLAGITVSWTAFLNGVYLGWPSALREILSKPNGVFMVQPSEQEMSWMVAALDIGTIFSPIPCYFLVDIWGRRPLLILIGPLSLLSWLLLYSGQSVTCLHIVRVIQGLQCGIANTITPLYISEISEPRIRGALNTIPGAALNVGVLYSYLAGMFESYHTLTTLCVLITIPYVIAVFFIPETPYFHLMRNEEEKARSIVLWSKNDYFDEGEFIEMKRSVEEDMRCASKGGSLFASRTDVKSLATCLLVYIGATFTYFWVIPQYASETFDRGSSALTPNQFTVLLGLLTLLGTGPAAYLIEKMGRKPLLLLSCILTAVFAFAAAIFFFIHENNIFNTSGYSWCICLFISGLLCSASLGLGQMPFILQSEYFPANSRGMAGAIVSGVGSVFSVIADVLYPKMDQLIGMYANFVISGSAALLVFVYCWYVMVETKGQTFAEIQAQFAENEMKRISKKGKC